jgi:predicted hotdog family 3-hydroxylacyl-ACP dehydratase/3-hydroxymyristoyl/3-hydroxydecanoyl-(acyl carrier protein) dehydratase
MRPDGPARPPSLLEAGTRLQVAIPASGPLYDGHFPGRPILPGVGLLGLTLRALVAAGAPPALREVPMLRLRRQAAPGAALDLAIEACDPDGRIRLELRQGTEVVANGVVVLGAQTAAIPAGALARPLAAAGEVPELDDLLPQRPPMRFVAAVRSIGDDGLTCAVHVPEGSAFDEHGLAPAYVALEMAAQSAAVFEGLQRVRQGVGGGPRIGFLVGVRGARFARASVPVRTTLVATARLATLAPPLATYLFEVGDGSDVIANGAVSTWLTATGA